MHEKPTHEPENIDLLLFEHRQVIERALNDVLAATNWPPLVQENDGQINLIRDLFLQKICKPVIKRALFLYDNAKVRKIETFLLDERFLSLLTAHWRKDLHAHMYAVKVGGEAIETWHVVDALLRRTVLTMARKFIVAYHRSKLLSYLETGEAPIEIEMAENDIPVDFELCAVWARAAIVRVVDDSPWLNKRLKNTQGELVPFTLQRRTAIVKALFSEVGLFYMDAFFAHNKGKLNWSADCMKPNELDEFKKIAAVAMNQELAKLGLKESAQAVPHLVMTCIRVIGRALAHNRAAWSRLTVEGQQRKREEWQQNDNPFRPFVGGSHGTTTRPDGVPTPVSKKITNVLK